MSDIEVSAGADVEVEDGKVSIVPAIEFDCPKCHVGISLLMPVGQETLLNCPTCGWVLGFTFRVKLLP